MSFEKGLAFVDHCATELSIQTLIDEFRDCIRLFNFEGSACGSWEGIGANRIARFFFVDWPEDVQRVYAETNMFERDPLVFAAKRRITPFTWKEVYEDDHLTPEMRQVYQFAYDLGWFDGLCVPIHGPGGYQGLVSLLARQRLALTARERALLEIMCRGIHDRCRATVGFGMSETAPPKLTPRETQCMKWVAAGKTNWEIGQLLGISASTAHFHIESAKKKLNKSTRTEAVAVLVLHGLL